MASMIDRC